MPKILITGANGQLGRELNKQLSQKGSELILTDVEQLDITDSKSVYKMINESRPEIIINCAAFTQVDACEEKKDLTFKINTIGAKNLAQASYNIGAEIVQISTDYVFDGEGSDMITEFDKPNPQSVYGNTKLLAEKEVENLNPKHYILRTAWLYGDGKNFVKTMLSLGEKNSVVNVVNDQRGTPTSTVDLSRTIIELLDEKNYGLFHCTCKGEATWYEFTKEIFKLKGINTKIVPCTTEEFPRKAKRPKYSVLRNYMLEMTTGDKTREWKEALKEYIDSI